MQHAVSLGASWICKGLRLALEPEADPRQRIILSGHQIGLEKIAVIASWFAPLPVRR